MPRQMLADEYWSKLRPILLQQDIHDKSNLRMTMEGILYRMRTGCQWRDLPEAFGSWNTVYKRFNAWSAAGKLIAVFNLLVEDPDIEWLFIDGSYVKAHQDSPGLSRKTRKPLAKVVQAIQVRFIWAWMPMGCRLPSG